MSHPGIVCRFPAQWFTIELMPGEQYGKQRSNFSKVLPLILVLAVDAVMHRLPEQRMGMFFTYQVKHVPRPADHHHAMYFHPIV
jgi:hypothetical protein